jgi:hypothetical protein
MQLPDISTEDGLTDIRVIHLVTVKEIVDGILGFAL